MATTQLLWWPVTTSSPVTQVTVTATTPTTSRASDRRRSHSAEARNTRASINPENSR